MPDQVGLEARNVAGAITSMRIDELISNLAIGIAKGQMELDQVCMDIAKFMGDAQIAFGKRAGSDEPDLLSLIELGFTPNFYQFVDTILEVRVAVSSQFEQTQEYDTSLTAMHSDQYNQQSSYEAQQSSSTSGSRGGIGVGWGWGGYHFGVSRSAYGAASSSSYATSSSYQQKNIAVTTVDAKYASTYNYAVEGSSLIKSKIVPVPPPQVFEEIVRSKIKQRREEEQRLRWLDQARTTLAGAAASAATALTDKDGLLQSVTTFKKTNAVKVQDSINGIRDEYNGMTTDHWAVIPDSVSLRQAADNALNTAVENAQKLVDLFPESGTSPGSDDIKNLLDGLKANLNTLKEKIQALREKIPAEEQETQQTA